MQRHHLIGELNDAGLSSIAKGSTKELLTSQIIFGADRIIEKLESFLPLQLSSNELHKG